MERLLLCLSALFRWLPDFRGKYRLGLISEKIFVGKSAWKNSQHLIRLKRGDYLFLDIQSVTHKAAFWTGRYDDDIIKIFCNIFETNWVIADVGASIGYYSIPFAKAISTLGNGKLLSFEPFPANYNVLVETVEKNGVRSYIDVYPFALGETEKRIQIFLNEAGSTGNAYISDKPWSDMLNSDSIEVEVKTLDGLIFQEGVCNRLDFLKMDIEGAEVLLLHGAKQTLKQLRPIVYGEFNSLFIRRFGYDILQVIDYMSQFDYVPFARRAGQFVRITPRLDLVDVLFVPIDKVSFLVQKGLINDKL